MQCLHNLKVNLLFNIVGKSTDNVSCNLLDVTVFQWFNENVIDQLKLPGDFNGTT